MFHYHTGTMTRRSEKLSQQVPETYVELHPRRRSQDRGIEAVDVLTFGEACTHEVAAAIPRAVAAVLAELTE
jgi:predicted molibdopterin-dependent oxidoreductase YjgC